MNRPVVLILGPHRAAVSGVSTHLNLLMDSTLGQDFDLVHFQVGIALPNSTCFSIAASGISLTKSARQYHWSPAG